MSTRMQQRRGTSEQWTTANPTLAEGEFGWESDTNQFKIGDGVNNWASLEYFSDATAISGSLEDYVEISLLGVADGVATLDATGQVPANQLGNAPDPDLTGLATEAYADQAEADAITAANSYTDAEIAAIPTPDLDDLTDVAITNLTDGDALVYKQIANRWENEAIPTPDFTGYATETYVNTAVAGIVDTAPEALNTLNELAAALGDDANFATTVATQIGGKADAVHTHSISDVTNLQASLDGKAASDHTHLLVDIADYVEPDSLPDQTGNTGKYLTTDGTAASWGELDIPPGTTISPTAPLGPVEGQTWWDSTDGTFYIYYGTSWVEAVTGVTGPEGPIGPAGPQGEPGPAGPSGIPEAVAVSSNVTMLALKRYFVDTTVARTLTLPASPVLGAEVQIFDANGSAGTNNITVNRNGQNINGIADNALLDVNGVAAVFVYTGTTYGWRMG